jgi:hypothetical protein
VLLYAESCGAFPCIQLEITQFYVESALRLAFWQFPELMDFMFYSVLLQNISTIVRCFKAQPKYSYCLGHQLGSVLTQIYF